MLATLGEFAQNFLLLNSEQDIIDYKPDNPPIYLEKDQVILTYNEYPSEGLPREPEYEEKAVSSKPEILGLPNSIDKPDKEEDSTYNPDSVIITSAGHNTIF